MTTNTLLHIDPAVSTRFPGIKIGIALIQDVTILKRVPSLEVLKKKYIQQIEQQFKGVDITLLPRIQCFREIYRAFGADPNSHRPSAEALIRRITKGSGLYNINTVVDTYNILSAFYQLPMAAYDFDKVSGIMELRFSREGEKHKPIGQEEYDILQTGELVYTDQQEVICREFNYRDSEKTKVTIDTQNIVLFTDGCAVVQPIELEKIITETALKIAELTDGKIETVQIYDSASVRVIT